MNNTRAVNELDPRFFDRESSLGREKNLRLKKGTVLDTLVKKEVAYAGVTQLVECQLPKLNVASSSLVARSDFSRGDVVRRRRIARSSILY